MDPDYADDIVLLAKTAPKAESQVHCLGQSARGIGLYVNADKMEFVFFY